MNLISPFSQNQYKYYKRVNDSWFNVAEGGKRGGKNVINIWSFAWELETHPDKIHLAAGFDQSAVKLNVVDSNGFGLLNHFEGRCREGEYKKRYALFIQTLTGEKIVMVAGLGKERDENRIAGQSYGMVYVTEANRCHPYGIQECFDRTLASSRRKIFHDLNPRAEGHWYYTDVLSYHETQQKQNDKYGYNYGHFTILDNLSLSQEHINKEIATYDKSRAWYQRDILGKRKTLEGLVYPMFNVDYHVVKVAARPYEKYWVSVDYGTYNPFSMGLWGLANGVYYRIAEYYHSGRSTNMEKTAGDYYRELENMTKGKKIESVIVDPSASYFIAEIRKHNKFHAKKANNDVAGGIESVKAALQQGKVKIQDNCKHLIREMGLYMWNAKSVEDVPVKENDHAQDDTRYFVHTLKIVRDKGHIIAK